ncbi:MAG: sulfatase-like hydrolase/transferase, partial [Pseudomonadota bacterium]
MTQPNILFLQVDQLFAAALNAYGNPFSITPHLDELFARGTTFENTYC